MTESHQAPHAESEVRRRLRSASRIVVKLGTSTVTDVEGGVCMQRVEPLVRSMARLIQEGRQVVLVSSGAVGLGRAWLELHPSRLRDMITKQACAAVGQSLLMDAYRSLFSAFSIKVAQVLLTEDDFTVWRRYSNLRHTIERLLQLGVIPVINENDTVSTVELAPVGEEGGSPKRPPVFSDNDRLAALVMSGLEADALVLLTNVDGFLRGGESHVGRRESTPSVIPVVTEITPELKALAAGPSANGRGGMLTKVEAAEIAMHCGGVAVIANGSRPGVLEEIFCEERTATRPGTAFLPLRRMKGKRRWIAFAAEVQGRIVVDAGAQRVITEGKASLLTSGIIRIESHFSPKDVVSIVDREGREFARGLASCASHEAEEMLSRKNRNAEDAAGRRTSRIVVRRDTIVLV